MAVLETKPVERSAAAGPTPPKSDAGAGHCAECHSPLAPDQAACLECGAVVSEPTRYKRWLSARWPLRTGLATAAIFVLSASVALAASVATQSGGNPPPQAFAGTKTPGQVPIVPPSTNGVSGADDGSSGNAQSAPTSTQSGGPSSTPAPKAPTTPAPTSPNPTLSSAPNTAGSDTPTTTSPANSAPVNPFPGGDTPAAAGHFGPGTDPNHPASDAIDGNSSTYWLTDTADSGIWIKAGDSKYSKLGVEPASGHKGFAVRLYGFRTKPTKATAVNDGIWIGGTRTINGTTTLNLAGTSFPYYALYVVAVDYSGQAGIAELSLIP